MLPKRSMRHPKMPQVAVSLIVLMWGISGQRTLAQPDTPIEALQVPTGELYLMTLSVTNIHS